MICWLRSSCHAENPKVTFEKFFVQNGNVAFAFSKQQTSYSIETLSNGGMTRMPSKVLTLKAADATADCVIGAVKFLKKPTPVVVTVVDPSCSILVQKSMVLGRD